MMPLFMHFQGRSSRWTVYLEGKHYIGKYDWKASVLLMFWNYCLSFLTAFPDDEIREEGLMRA